MVRHVLLALLCVPLLAAAASCGGGSSAPEAAASSNASALLYQPADGEEVQIILLSLLQEGRDACVEMAAGRRRFLNDATDLAEQTEIYPQFVASDSYTQGLRGRALAKSANELYNRPSYKSLLSGEDSTAVIKMISALERLCTTSVPRYTTDWDGQVSTSLTNFEVGGSQLSQYPVAAALRAEILDVQASLVEANYEKLAGRRDAAERAKELWDEHTETAAKDREQYEKEKEEYRRWLAEQERRQAERRRWQAEREAALAEAQRQESSSGRLGALSLKTTGPDPGELIAMRQWHDKYRIGIRAFRATLVDYEEAPQTAQMSSYRHDVCLRLAQAARQTLQAPDTLASPNRTVQRELTEAVRAFAEAADRCSGNNPEAERRSAEAGREHFRLAGEALEPYGLSI